MAADLSKIAANLVRNVATGEMVRLDSFWKDSSLGARDISAIHPQLKAHDVRLVGIGLEQLGVEDFIAGKFFSGELYIDEKKKSYEDLGYKRFTTWSVLKSLASRVAIAAFRRSKQENVGGNMAGDALQNGGTLVIEKGGKLLLDYKQDNPADHVSPDDVLKALNIPKGDSAAATANTTHAN